jgi:DNA invertase Pin-like site-specific DNA recombinase
MMMQMVGSFAEFERAMIRERTSAGLAAARAEGRIGGRRKKLDPAKRREIAESVISGRKTGDAPHECSSALGLIHHGYSYKDCSGSGTGHASK